LRLASLTWHTTSRSSSENAILHWASFAIIKCGTYQEQQLLRLVCSCRIRRPVVLVMQSH
jgi:hypothetical protein